MQTSRIKLLPDHVANQIAAGEVVQRPASVVKELMENAIDAGAQEIKLLVKDGGKTLIQVIDDGIGMNEIDARMSLERHATSKISSAEDLFSINTKGFRGEALASIVAIAHVEIKTKPENEELGTLLKIEGSKIVKQEKITTPKGTSIAVKNLFFNVPARRKFLKSVQVEMKHINDEFIRLALAHTQIAFTLIHNGNIVYQLPKSNLLQRITNLFNTKIKTKLVPIQEETKYIKISGYIGKPDTVKLKRGEQFFFVNNRFIKSPYLNHAILSAYEGLIKEKSYPAYFVFFEIDPKHIDVNIHPTKTEIKFDDEPTVYSILKVAAKHSLGQFNLTPSMDFDRKPDLDIPYEYNKKTPKLPEIEVNPDFNPFKEDTFKNTKEFSISHFEKETRHWDALMNDTKEVASKLFDENQHKSSNFLQVEGIQFLNKYILTTHQEKALFIHQQRAHELVLFEKIYRSNTSNPIKQNLVFPIELELSTSEIELIKSYENELNTMGFDLEFETNIILVTAIPSLETKLNIPEFFEDFIRKTSLDIPTDFNIRKEIAGILAKKSAIKTGQKLEKNSIEVLLKDLFQLESFMFTPDNKRIIISFTDKEITNLLNK